jgi:hypothetical protein
VGRDYATNRTGGTPTPQQPPPGPTKSRYHQCDSGRGFTVAPVRLISDNDSHQLGHVRTSATALSHQCDREMNLKRGNVRTNGLSNGRSSPV